MNSIKIILSKLFNRWHGKPPDSVTPLPVGGSNRQYFRLKREKKSAIGAFQPSRKEFDAFIGFTRHFRSLALPVPDLYAVDDEYQCCLLQDLGDHDLLSCINKDASGNPDVRTSDLYKQCLEILVRFQLDSRHSLNFDLCYPRKSFDFQSMLWDLNYYKYNYLKIAGVPFDENLLEEDFQNLMDFISLAPSDFFMYRDFQARNILIFKEKPWFIDYQGGRKGPLQYDLASLLFQVKADLPPHFRDEMLEYYLEKLRNKIQVEKTRFIEDYHAIILLRLLQVMGAYGYRGLIQKKEHFVTSIPYAVKNIRWFLDNVNLPLHLPELYRTLEWITANTREAATIEKKESPALTVQIRSFSFFNHIPDDLSGNGGGFVFDCRGLPNPGREEYYRQFNGKDQAVIEYLEQYDEVFRFLRSVYNMVDQTIDNYIQRGFTHLAVSFGCTGGQHRSVYCAESLARHLAEKYVVTIDLGHQELGGSNG